MMSSLPESLSLFHLHPGTFPKCTALLKQEKTLRSCGPQVEMKTLSPAFQAPPTLNPAHSWPPMLPRLSIPRAPNSLTSCLSLCAPGPLQASSWPYLSLSVNLHHLLDSAQRRPLQSQPRPPSCTPINFCAQKDLHP